MTHFRLVLATLLMVAAHLAYSQQQNSTLDQTIAAMAKENTVMGAAVGYAGTMPEQWKRYQRLKAEASDPQLVAFTDHESPAVRCYAFLALAEKGHPDLFSILANHLKDTAAVDRQEGCLGSMQAVGDYFIDVVTPGYVSLSAQKLDEADRQTLDSLLLFDPDVALEAKRGLMASIAPRESYYERLHEVYAETDDPNALLALARFQKEADVPLIKAWFEGKRTEDYYYGLRVIGRFPHPEFFPYLEAVHADEVQRTTGFNQPLIRVLYLSLGQYKTPETRALIETALGLRGLTYEYHSEYIWLALTKYPDPVFDGLIDRIQLTEYEKSELEYWLRESDR